MNHYFLRELFEERNSRLKSDQRNAKCPTSNTWCSYNGKSVFGFAVFNGDQYSSTIYLKSGFRIFTKKRSISTAIAIFPPLFICYAIQSQALIYSYITRKLFLKPFLTWLDSSDEDLAEEFEKTSATHIVSNNRVRRWKIFCPLLLFVGKYKAATSFLFKNCCRPL